ncbi:LuxR family transcriptional regulator [Lentzea sp. HUAS12]|uniref:helix-turn-helix transcriptional regulator n=1 Tax=Lentzea sp. HUAS12 TaxID=2951806 RepID=UPI0020A12AA7|nr:LuxR family transcriptional regulator [Lentzea sp. HUAS12]USX52823.1 LuxR C-terminal-related transcriptional regulator [Lentzea sp. HUAS12]
MNRGRSLLKLKRNTALLQLNEIMRAVRSGTPRLVLVEDRPGPGRSTVVEDWLDASSPLPLVFGARCLAPGARRTFAALGLLLAGMPRPHLDGLPLLRSLSPRSDPAGVARQLSVLAKRLTSAGPVVLVVDDAQWVDVASLRALGVLVRELGTAPVMTALVLRAAGTDPAVTAELASLLADVEGARLELAPADDRPVPVRHQGTAPRSAYGSESGVDGVPGSLELMVYQQLLRLPADARNLVEAVAVVDRRSPLDVVAAIGGVEDPVRALADLVRAGLVEWWPSERSTPVAVRHSSQRDAVLAMTTPARLRELHAAAAGVTCGETSWRHQIAVRTPGPSERLADEVEQAAHVHRRAGRLGRASTLLLWASKISENQWSRERRLLTAAAHSMWIDDFAKVTALLPQVRDCAPGPLKDLVLGAHGAMNGTAGDVEGLLFRAMATTEGVEGLEWVFMMAGTWLGLELLNSDCERAFPALDRVVSGPAPDLWLTARAQALAAIAVAFCEGPREGLDALAGMRSKATEVRESPFHAYTTTASGMLRVWDGDLRAGRRELDSVPAGLALACSSAASYLLGDWDTAVDSATRSMAALTAEDKSWAVSFSFAVASWVPAGRGDHEQAESLLQTAERALTGLSAGFLRFSLPVVALSRAVLAQAQGDHQKMLRALSSVAMLPDRGMKRASAAWWAPLRVEALIGTGDLGTAAQALAELEDLAGRIGYLRPVHAWLQGLLLEAAGDLPKAVLAYRSGLRTDPGAEDVPLHRARLEHSLAVALDAAGDDPGRWRQSASDRLGALGANAFVQRLALSPAAPAADTLPLRGREHTIALLVGRGRTNREIAAELFVSTKTVEYHLSNIYARLNLPNRRHLRDYVQEHTRDANRGGRD